MHIPDVGSHSCSTQRFDMTDRRTDSVRCVLASDHAAHSWVCYWGCVVRCLRKGRRRGPVAFLTRSEGQCEARPPPTAAAAAITAPSPSANNGSDGNHTACTCAHNLPTQGTLEPGNGISPKKWRCVKVLLTCTGRQPRGQIQSNCR